MISFSMTEQQVLERTKTVTRRLGWHKLRAGEVLRGVHKCMGLREGERPRDLALVRVVSVRREPLNAITDDDVAREGYSGMTAAEFVEKFTKAMGCKADVEVARIEFEYVPTAAEARAAGARS